MTDESREMRRDVADYRDAKAADDGERVALDELLSELDEQSPPDQHRS